MVAVGFGIFGVSSSGGGLFGRPVIQLNPGRFLFSEHRIKQGVWCVVRHSRYPKSNICSVFPVAELRYAASKTIWFRKPSSPGTGNGSLFSIAAANASTCLA